MPILKSQRCIACEGTGSNSKGGVCFPCSGTGKRKDEPSKKAEVKGNKKAAPKKAQPIRRKT